MTDVRDDTAIYHGDVRDMYSEWPAPRVIVSDGAYGVDGFDGDESTADGLRDWYDPHVRSWTEAVEAGATLWFWNTERGWAEVSPLIESYGWEYQGCNVWDKGQQFLAGNTNTERLQQFPIATEVCAHYVRYPRFNGDHPQAWLRSEWGRTGLTYDEANEACDVVDAATRKYLTADDEWYWPPAEMFEAMVDYANEQGDPDRGPYFAPDGDPLSAREWSYLRPVFDCPVGVRNVWREGTPQGASRVETGGGTTHPNQKPLRLIRRLVAVSSKPGDVIWEPFGGLCPASVAAAETGREPYAAEVQRDYYETARERLVDADPEDDRGQQALGQFA